MVKKTPKPRNHAEEINQMGSRDFGLLTPHLLKAHLRQEKSGLLGLPGNGMKFNNVTQWVIAKRKSHPAKV